MAVESAGILLHRGSGEETEVFLVHPGGPFRAKKDAGAWSIPKGLPEPNEDLLAAAKREFLEETGFAIGGEFRPLGAFKQPSGKIVHVWSAKGDVDPAALKSNDFELEWPPKSGKRARFPEIDRAGWFSPKEALAKAHSGQRPVLLKFFATVGIRLPA